ncbi:MAG: hypothetical protein ACYSSO_10690 [Planctomycetota bacterium]|jgi:hypothetical protein
MTVIKLHKPGQKEFEQFLEMLKEAYTENRIYNFICITEIKYKEPVQGVSAALECYWFSENMTSVGCLGLCDVMKENILQYMADRNREAAER